MRLMKWKKVKLCIALVVCLTIIGTLQVVATNQVHTYTDKTITTASIKVQLNMNHKPADDKSMIVLSSADFADGVVIHEVSVTNTANKDAYIRVKLTRKWKDMQGNQVRIPNASKFDTNLFACVSKTSEDWFTVEEDGVTWFYYKKKLGAGETSSNVCDALLASKLQEQNTNQYSNLTLDMQWEAQAIQTTAAKEAMQSEWSIYAEFTQQGDLAEVVKGESDAQ